MNLNSRYLAGAGISLAGLLIITLIYALIQWHDDWALTHQNLPEPALQVSRHTSNSANDIQNTHLFGKSLIDGGDIPISSLQLQVSSILRETSPTGQDQSRATISMGGQPAKRYQTGDLLTGNVKIYQITNDTVVLENNGELEKLPLPRKKLTFKARPNTGVSL